MVSHQAIAQYFNPKSFMCFKETFQKRYIIFLSMKYQLMIPSAVHDNEAWPLDEGYKIRKTLYNLYHILNHANLFGTSYLNQAVNMMQRLVQYEMSPI